MTKELFTQLVSVEQKSLRRFLLALCVGNREEADDIAQESLIKAYLSSSGYNDKGKFTAWLYKIAYNTFIDHMRSARTMSPLDDAHTVMDRSSADSTFEYQELYQALDGLPPKERTAVLLFYIKGYSINEIAEIVQCSTDAVKKQLSRGREHLKKTLER